MPNISKVFLIVCISLFSHSQEIMLYVLYMNVLFEI